MSGIILGKAIYQILSGSTQLIEKVGNKIYPIFAPDEILNPFIVYDTRINNINYTKDGNTYDECVLLINIISDNYSDNKDISELVRSILELKVGSFNNVQIIQSLLSNVTDTFGIDGFITTMEFTIKCK